MKISRSAKLGLLISITLIIFVWGFNYLKGKNLISFEDLYYVKYTNITGLQESAEVTINGYRVGQVRDIVFTDDQSGDLIVTFALTEPFKLPKGTVARIASKDFMGTMIIKLELSSQQELHTPSDTLVGATETALIDLVSAELAPLKDKAEDIFSKLDTTISSLNKVINKENRKSLSNSISKINETFTALSNISKEIEGQKENISGVVSNFKSISDSLNQIKWKKISDNAEQSLTKLNDVLVDAQDDKGTLGKFLTDSSLYSNINSTVLQLDHLISNIEANPKKYLKLSAIDWGKDYYVISKEDKALQHEIHFAVKLLESDTPIDLKHKQFKNITNLNVIKKDKKHIYLEDRILSPDAAIFRCEELKISFPDAEIWAFHKGKHVKMEKITKYFE